MYLAGQQLVSLPPLKAPTVIDVNGSLPSPLQECRLASRSVKNYRLKLGYRFYRL